MNVLALIVAFFMTGFSFNSASWLDQFLNNLVGVETWLMGFVWVLWAILLVVGGLILFFAFKYGGKIGCVLGCFIIPAAIGVLLFPLWQYISLRLAQTMAESVGPTGILNQSALIISAIIFLLLSGTGG